MSARGRDGWREYGIGRMFRRYKTSVRQRNDDPSGTYRCRVISGGGKFGGHPLKPMSKSSNNMEGMGCPFLKGAFGEEPSVMMLTPLALYGGRSPLLLVPGDSPRTLPYSLLSSAPVDISQSSRISLNRESAPYSPLNTSTILPSPDSNGSFRSVSI